MTILSGNIGNPNDASDNINNLVFDANHATLDGFTITGGNATITSPYPEVVGGGIFINNSSTFRNLIISGNNAAQGGGIAVVGGQPALSNVLVTGNTASYGAGIDCHDGQPTFVNVTISGNAAVTAGGGVHASSLCSLTMRNSIVWGNDGGEIESPGTVDIGHSIVEGGLPSGTTDSGGNVTSDPLFVSPVAASNAPTTAGDYHLQSTSPAINAGSNAAIPSGISTDIDGDARILSGTVDMGADEVRTACTVGNWSATGDDRTGSCTPASIGYYVDTTGADHQTACPAGQTTAGTGSTSVSACFMPYVSPYARKQAAAAELQALLPTGSSAADNRLTKGIANINSSLASWRWTSADSLNPAFGWRVFNFERHAITWLWAGPLLSNPTLSAVANDAVNQLVAADREIVVKAIANSTDSAAIAKANAKLAQADALIALQQRASAIYKLRAAWLAVN